ncbi:hypothetical protein DYBT9275_02836 [Dyadobacter sp. CECT 9275]|uniref:FecR family protein n=1 Tax=Dyadobacter helix TaxID=2822344 RepID=A0A916JDC6_9BACT|nr:FecR family protein [Dyadobacter sp. CECT 9275]CAG5002202.1 hypothetical protein DYBT9275_02836 [Dyadobacter sp. CECT 9275]
MDSNRTTYLFYRHFDETATEEEKLELAALLENSENEALIKQLMEEAWQSFFSGRQVFPEQKSRRILNNILNSNNRPEQPDYEEETQTLLWRRISIAVSILLVIGTSLYYWAKTPSSLPAEVVRTSGVSDIEPGGNKALLTLSDGSTILLDNASEGELTRQGNVSVIKIGKGQLAYKVTNTGKDAQPAYNILKTPRGGQYNVVLPDGSKVWLNAASSIRYPTVFDEHVRSVEINGEAYFEINTVYRKSLASQGKVPFMVKVNDVEVEVLGTHFNINAYGDEEAVETTLLEGSVRIRKGDRKSLLKPGQQASILEKSVAITIKNVDVQQSVAWKNGYFRFNKTGLPEIMRQLTKWYDVTVRYEGKLPDRKFSGEIPRSATLSQVLEILEVSKVHLNVEGKEIVLKP